MKEKVFYINIIMCRYKAMKQLDVVVSPPALVWDPYLTLTNVTFDPTHVTLWRGRDGD